MTSMTRALRSLYRDNLARASGLILMTSVITALLGFGYWVLAARTYPAAEVGTAAVSVSMMTLASLVSTLGTTAGPVQRIPLLRTARQWNRTVSVSLAVGGVAGALAGMLGWLILVALIHTSGLRSPSYAAALVLGVAFTNGAMVLDSIWVIERITEWRLVTNTLTSIAKLPLLAVPALHAQGASGIQWGWTAGVAFGLAAGVLVLRWKRNFRFVMSGITDELRAMRRSMVGNYIMSLGAQAPTYVVPVLVGAAVSASQTAYFYAAWRIGSLFFLAASAVSNALFAEGAHTPARSVRLAQRAILFLVPILLVVTLTLLLAGPLLLDAFGAAYRASALDLLLLLIAAAIPDAITAVYRTVLRIGHQFLQGSILMWGLAVIQVGITWPFLAIWGISGAGVAWLLAESAGVMVAGVDRWLHGDFASRAEARAQVARARPTLRAEPGEPGGNPGGRPG
ncbi:MAG: hypothetical protein M0027_02710 [Candidatus Dormibacteraeota bacterium]|nr:hypothetical protein [Candidatus Dormibacteraeota bacterium]